MDDFIRRILSRVPGVDASRATVTPLGGGITNRNYKVEGVGEPLVLRVSGENTEVLGIDRRSEYAASAIAASLGLGAEVVCFLDDENALVTRFIPGRGLTPEAAARPQMLRRIVEAIRRCHQGPPFPGVFSAFETVRTYHRLARERGVSFPTETSTALQSLGRIEAALGVPDRLVPCHNDLLAGNFIDDGRAIRILDWEYAGMGDRCFDLGNFAVNQALGPPQHEVLLEAYFGCVRSSDMARLSLMRLASDLRESSWGFLQSGVSKLEFDFRKYALDHLERFLKNVAGPDFERWLALAAVPRKQG